MKKPLLGAHMSIAGGVAEAISRAHRFGCTAMQIFVGNPRQWRRMEVTPDMGRDFGRRCPRLGIRSVVAHANYLINVASHDRRIREGSERSLAHELSVCGRLGIPYLILHPGSCDSPDRGIQRVARALDRALEETERWDVGVLLETTAGQGNCLGHTFAQLADIIGLIRLNRRVGVCLDTAHVFVAGYDIRTPKGYNAVMEDLDSAVGLPRLKAVHVNDSKGALGSRLDRHEHIGRGEIGSTAFRCIMRDARLRRLPKILETPKAEQGGEWDRRNLRLLRKMAER